MSSINLQELQDLIDSFVQSRSNNGSTATDTDTETIFSSETSGHTTINNITINNITNNYNVYRPVFNPPEPQPTVHQKKCTMCKRHKNMNEYLSAKKCGYTKLCQSCRDRCKDYNKQRKDRITAAQNARDIQPEDSDVHKKKICNKCGKVKDLECFKGIRGQIKKACNECYAKFLENNKCAHNINRLICDKCYPHLFDVNNYRANIAALLRGVCVPSHIIDSLGCSERHLKDHLERQFTSTMSWANHRDVWQIDFYYPLLEIVNGEYLPLEEIERRKHYTNIRPIEKIENLRKGNKAPEDFYPEQ
jgi:hypothetical protein